MEIEFHAIVMADLSAADATTDVTLHAHKRTTVDVTADADLL